MKKSIALILAMLMLLTAFAGCGSEPAAPASEGSEEPESVEPAAEPAGDGEKVTVLYCLGDMTLMDDYDLMPEGIEVEWMYIPENDLETQIVLETSSGSSTYDAAIMMTASTKTYGGPDGILEPMPEFDGIDGILDSCLQMATCSDDVLYSYPLMTDVNVLLYNKDILEAAGYTEAPKTWDEYFDMAVRMTVDANGVHGGEAGFDKDNVEIYGTNYKGVNGISNIVEFLTYTIPNGYDFLTNDVAAGTWEWNYSKPEISGLLQKFHDLVWVNGAMPKSCSSYDYEEYYAIFAEGKIGMCCSWVAMYDVVTADDSSVKDVVYCAPIPAGATGTNSTIMGGWCINVFKTAPHKEAALKVAQAIASTDGIAAYCTIRGTMPASEEVLNNWSAEALAQNNPQLSSYYDAALGTLENCVTKHSISGIGTAVGAFYSESASVISAILADEMTVEEGTTYLDETLTEVLTESGYVPK